MMARLVFASSRATGGFVINLGAARKGSEVNSGLRLLIWGWEG